MREIENYMSQRTREKQKRKKDRESAGTRKGKSGNLLFSDKHLEKEDEVDDLECYEPVSRKLFSSE